MKRRSSTLVVFLTFVMVMGSLAVCGSTECGMSGTGIGGYIGKC